jgi:heparanase 1
MTPAMNTIPLLHRHGLRRPPAARIVLGLMLVVLPAAAVTPATPGEGPVAVTPAKLARIGTVDERFQSFNVEMVEVTGGRFWAPYSPTAGPAPAPPAKPGLSTPAIDPAAFRNRPPIDLASSRLRRLAAALGPAYMRVSGTWANSTYFHDSDAPAPATPPDGFGGILTRQQWRGVIEFSRAASAKIITSFAISAGVRDANGLWTADEARKLLAFTKASGGSIAAAEFFNEPNIAAFGGAPKGYDAAAYGRDFLVFRLFARATAPDMLILGPGSAGEPALTAGLPGLKTDAMLTATGRGVDAFSYHFYGAVSKRCAAVGAAMQTTPEAALTEDWLSRTDRDAAFYAALRDRFEPGRPMWLTETAEAACGGNPWAATFIDSFRYLDQLGRLARRGVQVVAHNTLAASDYGLIDEATLTPRPDYWSALLWRRLMGATVLDAPASSVPGLHLYAHCLRGRQGGVALLALNVDRADAHDLQIPMPSERFSLTARDLLDSTVQLNGRELTLAAGDSMPETVGQPAPAGRITLAPASITFLAFPNAGNASCR